MTLFFGWQNLHGCERIFLQTPAVVVDVTAPVVAAVGRPGPSGVLTEEGRRRRRDDWDMVHQTPTGWIFRDYKVRLSDIRQLKIEII